MRILHLIDPLSPWAGPCTLRVLADFIDGDRRGAGGAMHDVLIVGRAREVNEARACGVDPLGSLPSLRGRTLGASKSLSRWMNEARRLGAEPHLIHAWSTACGALATVAAPSTSRVVTPEPAAIDIHSPHLVARQIVRERWQREDAVQGDEFVIGLLGEPAERFDARQAMHVGARTGLSSRRIRLVMSGRSLGRAEAQRFLARLDLDSAIIQDEGVTRPWEVLRGLDAALLMGPGAAGFGERGGDDLSAMLLLWAHAAGVPVIAEASAPLANLLEPDRAGLSFPAGDLNAACDRVARLHDDRALARRLAEAGRELVERRFSLALFRQRVNEAYAAALHEQRSAFLPLPA